jgi:hypothetical protein
MPKEEFATNVHADVVRQFTWQECAELIPKWQHLVGNVRELVDEAGKPAGQTWMREHKGVGMYVGRKMPGRFPVGSRFGNPFHLPPRWTEQDRVEIAASYLQHVLAKLNLRNEIPRLRGEKLWCWCAPDLCHAHVLAVLANELPGPDADFVSAGLERLKLHLLSGNFEMARDTVTDLERTYAEDNLPRGELSKAEREALSLVELGLAERTRNTLEQEGVYTGGQLALFVLSGRTMPANVGKETVAEIERKLRQFELLPEIMRRGMKLDQVDRSIMPWSGEEE